MYVLRARFFASCITLRSRMTRGFNESKDSARHPRGSQATEGSCAADKQRDFAILFKTNSPINQNQTHLATPPEFASYSPPISKRKKGGNCLPYIVLFVLLLYYAQDPSVVVPDDFSRHSRAPAKNLGHNSLEDDARVCIT